MPISQDKIKATDYLTESLKLIVVVVTILMTGFLTFQDQVNVSNMYYFYIAISFWLFTLIWSIINLNLLINKIYRGEDDAIKQNDTKNTFLSITFTLSLGIVFAIIFLFNISTPSQQNMILANQISITNNAVIMDGNFSKKITIIKYKDGSIKELNFRT